MRFRCIAPFWEFIGSVIKGKQDQQPLQHPSYRLLEVKQTPSGQVKLTVQAVGKSLVAEFTPEYIVDHEPLLAGFCPKDLSFITHLANEQRKKPNYKIVMLEFCDKFNRMLFKLKKHDSSELIAKTAGQITLDKSLINSLSQEDVCRISYIAGYEQSYLEIWEEKASVRLNEKKSAATYLLKEREEGGE